MKEKATTPILKVINVIITILFVFGNQIGAVTAFADSNEADKQEKKLVFKDQQQKVTADLIKGEQYTFDLTTELRPGKNKLAFSADKFSIAEFKQAPLPERVSLVGDKKQGYTLNLNADEKQQVHLYLQVTAAGLMDKQELTLKVQQEKFEFGEISIVKKQTAANDTDAQNDISKVTTAEDALSAGKTSDSSDSSIKSDNEVTTKKKSESSQSQESSQAKEDRKNSSIKATSKDQTTTKSQTNGGTSKQNKTPKNSSSDNAKSESSDDDADGDADADIDKTNKDLQTLAEAKDVEPTRNISNLLGDNESLFSNIHLKITTGNRVNFDDNIKENTTLPAEIQSGSDFFLTYDFNVNDINQKLSDTGNDKMQVGDYYEFKVKGLNHDVGEEGQSGALKGTSPWGEEEVFGTYEITQVKDEEDAVKIKFIFTNERPINNDGEYQFKLNAKYPGSGPVVIEYREDAIVNLDVSPNAQKISKSGVFVGTDKIQWKIEVITEMNLQNLSLKEVYGDGQIAFEPESWVAYVDNDTNTQLTYGEDFTYNAENQTIKFLKNINVSRLTFRLTTQITDQTRTEFNNKIEGYLNEAKFGNVIASVTRKNTGNIKKVTSVSGKYKWTAAFSTFKYSDNDLKTLTFKDIMPGNNKQEVQAIYVTDTYNAQTNNQKDLFTISNSYSEADKAYTLAISLKNTDETTLNAVRNKYIQVVYYTDISKDSEGSDLAKITNKFYLEINGQKGTDTTATVENSNIKKSVTAQNFQAQTINWRIIANESLWTFTSDYILTDTLSNGVDFAKDGDSYDLSKIIITVGTEEKTLSELVNDNKVSYEFKKTDNKNNQLVLTFKSVTNEDQRSNPYSGKKITIDIQDTAYDFEQMNNNDNVTNTVSYKVGASAGSAEAVTKLPDRIFKDAYKSGDLQLDSSNGGLTGSVEWTIGFNTREDTLFGTSENRTNEVIITDILNGGKSEYLKFADKVPSQADIELYELDRATSDSQGDKYKINLGKKVDKDDYRIVSIDNGDTTQKYAIRFNKDMDHKAFAVKFTTEIDFEAWTRDDNPQQPEKQTYINYAEVKYNDKRREVGATTSMKTSESYMTKEGINIGGGLIQWKGKINISGKDLSGYNNIKIKDEPTGGHHLLLQDKDGLAFKLYEANITGYVNGQPQLEQGKKLTASMENADKYDYVISSEEGNEDGFTVTFHKDYKLNKPLMIEYVTKLDKNYQNQVHNKLSLTADNYSINTKKSISASSSGSYYTYEVLLNKKDENTQSPLKGATFQLQEKVNGTWKNAKNLLEKDQVATTNANGQLQFSFLDRSTTYRVIETKAPDGYLGNYTSEEFNFQSHKKEVYSLNVPNNPNPEVGALKLHKTTKGESTNKQFSFKVEALNGEEIDDSINGSFNIAYSDGTTGKVQFVSGKSDVIKLKATESATLTDLFITNPLTKKTIAYKVTETDSQGYQTEMSVNGDEPILSNERDGIQLSETERTVVDIINSNHLGDLVVRKQVTGPTADKDQVFKFNVLVSGEQATKVAGKTFAAKILNADDQTVGTTKEVTFEPDADAEGNFRLTKDFELKDGQRMFINGLPQELNARALEVKDADDPYETTSTPATGSETTDEGYLSGHVEINEDVDRLINFNNHLPSGTFQLSKQVVGAATDKDFTFELTTNKLTGEVKGQLIKSNGDSEATTVSFNDQGKAKVTLKNNERLILSGLAVETTIQVTETADTQYQTSNQLNNKPLQSGLSSDTATIKDDDTQAITFYNQDHTGALLVEKQVTNLPTHEAKEEFTFKVNFDGNVDNTFQLTILENGKKISSTDVSATDNQLEFKLKDGQQALISGLKTGTKATVVETTNADYQTSHRKVAANDWIAGHQTEALTVQEDELDGFQFRNEFLTADFKLTKTVSAQSDKASIDPDGKYRFDVYLLKNDTSGLTEANLDDYLLSDFHQYDYDLLEDGHKVTEGVLTVNNGHTTTVLKKDQTIHIKNLKQGQKVMAREQNSDTYQATYQVKGSETSDTAPVITLDEAQEVLVNNQYLDQPKVHTLTIDKTVTGSTTKEAFEFKLKLFENHTEPYVTPITASKNHNPFINLEANEQNEYTFKLSNQDTITFKLPAGISYQVVESTQDERFTTEVEGNNVKRAGNKLSGELALTSDNTQSVHFYNQFGIEPPEEEGITPPDTDDTGTPPTSGTTTTTGSDTGKKDGLGFLPQTGEGRAYFLLTVLGLMILAVSGYYLYRNKRS